jgi:hypothetical protein
LGKNSQHENPSKRYRHTVALCATISAQSPAVGFSEAFVGFFNLRTSRDAIVRGCQTRNASRRRLIQPAQRPHIKIPFQTDLFPVFLRTKMPATGPWSVGQCIVLGQHDAVAARCIFRHGTAPVATSTIRRFSASGQRRRDAVLWVLLLLP